MDFPERITIDTHTIEIVPRYAETDKAGLVHHSVYPIWFEMGRTELMRRAGAPYGVLEDEGLFFPVVEVGARYLAPARYDEELEVRTVLSHVGGATVRFDYELSRVGDDKAIATGSTIHVATNEDGKPCRLPPKLVELFQ